MKPRHVVGLAALLAGAVVLLTVHTDEAQRSSVTAANRYTQLVNEIFIPKRWLQLEQRAGRDGPQLIWVPPKDPQQRQVAERYLQRSYLGEDVARFNSPRSSADRQLFTLEQGKLRVSADSHVFTSPFQQRGQWLGRLYYSGAAVPSNLVLQSLDVEPQRIEIAALSEPFAAARAHEVDVALFGMRSAPDATASVVRFLDASRREVALAWRIGNGMVVQLRAEATPIRVRVNGKLLAPGKNSIHHLPRRAVLLFENERLDAKGTAQRRAWVVRDAEDPNLIYDASNQVWHGAPNPLMARVAEAFDAAARSAERQIDASVTLTLSRSAEQAASEVLRRSIAALQAERGALPERRAAITLMDATTGALLALPSWPELPVAAEGGRPASLDSLPENHNLTRLAPGSVAKILYAAAILETHPHLLGLEVNVLPDSFASVAGIPLAEPIAEEGPAGRLNFTNAIAYSANRYAATLLTLGSDQGEAAQGELISEPLDRFALHGVEQSRRPGNLLFEPGRAGILMGDVEWARRMRELYEINTSSTASVENSYRRYVWAGLPRPLRLSGIDASLLDAISPATENLQLDRIDERDFRTRFLPLILGGGESRWSNVALAEAFASIVANRRVRARLVANAEANGMTREASVPSAQFMDPEVRQALLTGMSSVVKFGTASRTLATTRRELARAACMKGQAFELYGKTGTPELEDYVLSPAAVVFNQMAQDGLFIREPGSGRISYTGLSEQPLERKDLAALRAAVKRPEALAAKHFKTYFRSSLAHGKCGRRSPQRLWEEVFAGIVLDNNDKLEQRYQTVLGEGGELFSDRSCVNKAASNHLIGKHFVFVAAVYDQFAPAGALGQCAGKLPEVDPAATPARAIAGVVAVENVPEGQQRVALEAARRLLLGPVAEQLGLSLGAPRVASKTAGAERDE